MNKSPIKNNVEMVLSKSYQNLLAEIKDKVRRSQIKAAVAVNQELTQLYWDIGQSIHLKQEQEGWGAKTIERLAKDLKLIFPDMKGFSRTNLSYMVQFSKTYPDMQIIHWIFGLISGTVQIAPFSGNTLLSLSLLPQLNVAVSSIPHVPLRPTGLSLHAGLISGNATALRRCFQHGSVSRS